MEKKPEHNHPLYCLKMMVVYIVGFAIAIMVLNAIGNMIQIMFGR
jgi:hypothetical protein